jgi:hypothetical protein
MIGLAAGDALGTTLEFKAPGTSIPITDMVGGGPLAPSATPRVVRSSRRGVVGPAAFETLRHGQATTLRASDGALPRQYSFLLNTCAKDFDRADHTRYGGLHRAHEDRNHPTTLGACRTRLIHDMPTDTSEHAQIEDDGCVEANVGQSLLRACSGTYCPTTCATILSYGATREAVGFLTA